MLERLAILRRPNAMKHSGNITAKLGYDGFYATGTGSPEGGFEHGPTIPLVETKKIDISGGLTVNTKGVVTATLTDSMQVLGPALAIDAGVSVSNDGMVFANLGASTPLADVGASSGMHAPNAWHNFVSRIEVLYSMLHDYAHRPPLISQY